ncbi:MAG: multiheme c-type cytochrome, partial [Gammaproteobacteria bacterium]
ALDTTPGHQGLEAKTLPAALGVVYQTFDPEPKIMRCFRCHSTGRLSLGPKLEIRPAELGVRCEACHGPGSLHREAVSRGEIPKARGMIQNPRRLSAAELNQFCGVCHRKPAPAGAATNWTDPWNTRHQPLYLSQSACFQKSKGALSCLTCHDVHNPLRKSEVSYYNGRCAACHKPKDHPALKAHDTEDCVGCHMPRVAPREHLRFTNHWIGVYRNEAKLQPER